MTNTNTRYTLLCLLITGCVCGPDLTVWQSPEIINAAEGQDVNISCHFTVKSAWERLRVEWWRDNKTEVKQETYNISALNSINPESENYSSVLQIPSVRRSHSGIYYCTVWQDLPTLGEKVHGPGTELRVEAPAPISDTVPDIRAPLFISLLIAVCSASLLIITYKFHRLRPTQQKEGQMIEASEPDCTMTTVLYSYA
ncbi:hypothetical protein SRHO_G00328980 [Serrasalmus rhombeus]